MPSTRSALASTFAAGAAALAAVGLLCTGCARTGATPQDTLRAYALALEADDPDRALRLLSSDAQARTSRPRLDAEFERRVAAGRDYSQALRRAANGSATIQAELAYSPFERLELELRDGRWVIVGGVGASHSQASPRDTVVTFIRAVARSDAATMLHLMPAEYRARVTEADLERWMADEAVELEVVAALLRSSVDSAIRRQGDEATVRYGARVMRLQREGERWVIADFE